MDFLSSMDPNSQSLLCRPYGVGLRSGRPVCGLSGGDARSCVLDLLLPPSRWMLLLGLDEESAVDVEKVVDVRGNWALPGIGSLRAKDWDLLADDEVEGCLEMSWLRDHE